MKPALVEITPEVLLKAYACGIFPMAESADDPALYWIEPERRGVLPLDSFHVPARLKRTVHQDRYRVVCDLDFDAVIDACAEPAAGRARTWINARIRALYRGLYARGHCHTVEVYDSEPWLVVGWPIMYSFAVPMVVCSYPLLVFSSGPPWF